MYRDIQERPRQSREKRRTLINPECKAEGYKTVFQYQKGILGRLLWASHNSVIRIIPGNDGKNTLPQNIDTTMWSEDGDQMQYLSDTFYMTSTVSRFGDSGLDLISNLRPGSEDAKMYPESPINYFCNTIHRTMRLIANGKSTRVKPIPDWSKWTGMKGILPFPRLTLFMQAMCITINGRNCKQSPEEDAKDGALYGLIGINHKASMQALVKALVAPMDRSKPIGPSNNTYGALAEADGNILFLNTAQDKDQRAYLMPSVQAPDAPRGWNPTRYPIPENICKNIWTPWTELLGYMSVREQLELIAAEFGPDSVNYVFSLDPLWETLAIPDRIKLAGMGRYAGKTEVKPQSAPSFPTFNIPSMPSMPEAPKEFGDTTNIPGIPSSTESTVAEPSWQPPNAGVNMDELKSNLAAIQATQAKAQSAADVANSLLSDLGETDV